MDGCRMPTASDESGLKLIPPASGRFVHPRESAEIPARAGGAAAVFARLPNAGGLRSSESGDAL
jgi:hypothetical protein